MAPLLLAVTCGCGPDQAERARLQAARSLVGAEAERLDDDLSAWGGYARPGEGSQFDLAGVDPWEHRLKVTYIREGFAEFLTVRSAGPDGLFFNDDDISEQRETTAFGGVGSGLRKNAAALGAKAARGVGLGSSRGAGDREGKGIDAGGVTGAGKPP